MLEACVTVIVCWDGKITNRSGRGAMRFPAQFGERVSVEADELDQRCGASVRPSSSRAVQGPAFGPQSATIVSKSAVGGAVDMSPTQNACTGDVLCTALQVTPVTCAVLGEP